MKYFLFDGAMGYDEAVKMVKNCDFDIISKLRKDSALEFPNEEVLKTTKKLTKALNIGFSKYLKYLNKSCY